MNIQVITHPNAKNPRVVEDKLGILHVYVSEPPLEGRANQAVIESLAKHFNVKKNQVFLVSGDKNKNKIFQIL